MLAVTKSEATIEVVTPVLQILPGLLEMGQEPNSPMSMVQLKVDLPEASAMPLAPTPLEPTLPLAFMEQGGLDVVVPSLPESTRQDVSPDEEVVMSGALAYIGFQCSLCKKALRLPHQLGGRSSWIWQDDWLPPRQESDQEQKQEGRI
jgi:hypothetical protein